MEHKIITLAFVFCQLHCKKAFLFIEQTGLFALVDHVQNYQTELKNIEAVAWGPREVTTLPNLLRRLENQMKTDENTNCCDLLERFISKVGTNCVCDKICVFYQKGS